MAQEQALASRENTFQQGRSGCLIALGGCALTLFFLYRTGQSMVGREPNLGEVANGNVGVFIGIGALVGIVLAVISARSRRR
jgi:hypothetical protein